MAERLKTVFERASSGYDKLKIKNVGKQSQTKPRGGKRVGKKEQMVSCSVKTDCDWHVQKPDIEWIAEHARRIAHRIFLH